MNVHDEQHAEQTSDIYMTADTPSGVDPKLEREITTTINAATAVVVNSPESHNTATNMVLSLDGLIKVVKDYWKGPKEAAYRAHKQITAKEADMLRPMETQRKEIARKISDYLTEQDRLRQQEYARLQEEQRKAEEAERQRLLDEAAKAEAAGDKVTSDIRLKQATDVEVEAPRPPAPVVPQTLRTDNGTVAQRRDVEVTITDQMAVLKAVVAGDLPIGVITIHESKIKAHVKLTGVMQIPGCSIRQIVAATYKGGR